MTIPKLYRHNGLSLPLKEWAEVAGISFPTLEARLRRGWGFADAVSHGPGERTRQGSRLFTYQRKTLSMSEWARIAGVSLTTLHSRLSEYGWSFKDAMTHDPGERRITQGVS